MLVRMPPVIKDYSDFFFIILEFILNPLLAPKSTSDRRCRNSQHTQCAAIFLFPLDWEGKKKAK